MAETNREAYTFRLYVSGQKSNRDVPVLYVYWDTPDRGKALIDPFIYDHAARGDLEGCLLVAEETDAGQTKPLRYFWTTLDDDDTDYQIRAALVRIGKVRGAELQKFLGQCWNAMQNRPNTPFRAVFR